MFTWRPKLRVDRRARPGALGSYTNRELVLLDGHPTNDDWIGRLTSDSTDARISRTSSASRSCAVRDPFSMVRCFLGSHQSRPPGTGRASRPQSGARLSAQAWPRPSASTSTPWKGRWRLGQAAGAHGVGEDFYFPELRTGSAPFADGQSEARRLRCGNRAGTGVVAVAHRPVVSITRTTKALPTGEFDTLLGDPRTPPGDTRGFVEARAEPSLSRYVQLLSRLHWKPIPVQRRLRPPPPTGVERDGFDGAWVG